MKRAGRLIEQIADIDNLRLSVWKAARGKRYSREVLAYTDDLDFNLLDLQDQILEGKVRVGSYRYFKIYEPKERQICASSFGEQVLHHALMNICHPIFDHYLIEDSFASRKNKGVHAALDRAQHYTKKYAFFLKLDVKKFFDSIHQDVLKSQLSRRFKDKQLLSIFYQIIDSYQSSKDRGVPIGNLTSQYFANHYLANLDRFIKQKLLCRAYVRYMDDMVLWHESKLWLKQAHQEIVNYVESDLKCEMKPEQLNRTSLGVPFLGYRIFYAYRRLLHKSKIRFIRKMKRARDDFQANKMTEKQYQCVTSSLLSFICKAQTQQFRKSILLLS